MSRRMLAIGDICRYMMYLVVDIFECLSYSFFGQAYKDTLYCEYEDEGMEE